MRLYGNKVKPHKICTLLLLEFVKHCIIMSITSCTTIYSEGDKFSTKHEAKNDYKTIGISNISIQTNKRLDEQYLLLLSKYIKVHSKAHK